MALAENLKHLQDICGMTTDQLAEKSGVPASTITKIRSKVTLNPNMDTLQRLSVALDCSINDLTDTPSVTDEDLRGLLPQNLPSDPQEMLALFLATLRNQRVAHERFYSELRKDRNYWRKMVIVCLGFILPVMLFTAVMVTVMYWDLSHPSEGNIIWSAVVGAAQNIQ